MSPQAAREQLSALLDGELDEAEAAAVEAAVKADPQLQSELDRLRGVQTLLRTHGRVTAPEGFQARLMQQLESEPARHPWWRRPFGVPLEGLLVAAAAALVLFASLPQGSSESASITAAGAASQEPVAAIPASQKTRAADAKPDQVDDNDAVVQADPLGSADALQPVTSNKALPSQGKGSPDGDNQASPAILQAPAGGDSDRSQPVTESEATTGLAVEGKATDPGYTLGNAGYEITVFATDTDVLLALQRVAATHQGVVQDMRGRPTSNTQLTEYSTQLYVEIPAEHSGAFVRDLESLGKVQYVQTNDLIQGPRIRVPITLKQIGSGTAD